jgi:hypothetical protein
MNHIEGAFDRWWHSIGIGPVFRLFSWTAYLAGYQEGYDQAKRDRL